MPTPNKPKRVSRSITLPPDLDRELQRQADERLLNPTLLVERSLVAYFATLPPIGESHGS